MEDKYDLKRAFVYNYFDYKNVNNDNDFMSYNEYKRNSSNDRENKYKDVIKVINLYGYH